MCFEKAKQLRAIDHPAVEIPLFRRCAAGSGKGVNALGSQRLFGGPRPASQAPTARGINTNGPRSDSPAPFNHRRRIRGSELLPVATLIERHRMKPLFRPADIDADDYAAHVEQGPTPSVEKQLKNIFDKAVLLLGITLRRAWHTG